MKTIFNEYKHEGTSVEHTKKRWELSCSRNCHLEGCQYVPIQSLLSLCQCYWSQPPWAYAVAGADCKSSTDGRTQSFHYYAIPLTSQPRTVWKKWWWFDDDDEEEESYHQSLHLLVHWPCETNFSSKSRMPFQSSMCKRAMKNVTISLYHSCQPANPFKLVDNHHWNATHSFPCCV
jgi:hypothetical protein